MPSLLLRSRFNFELQRLQLQAFDLSQRLPRDALNIAVDAIPCRRGFRFVISYLSWIADLGTLETTRTVQSEPRARVE